MISKRCSTGLFLLERRTSKVLVAVISEDQLLFEDSEKLIAALLTKALQGFAALQNNNGMPSPPIKNSINHQNYI
jgi:hypothetical protein